MNAATPRSRWRRVAGIVVLALVALELAYLGGANFILRTQRIEQWVHESTDRIRLQLDGAYTVWPGRVHLDRAWVRVEDHNVQFSVSIEHVVADVSLLELPARALHLTRVRGDNVQYLFRHKVEGTKGIEKRLAHYPKIAGFADPPLYTEGGSAPLGDEEYDLWRLELDDVEVSVRELWFLEYRFVGEARASGGLRLQPQRRAETPPCVLTVDGTLSAGPNVVANAFRGQIDFQLHPFDPREVSGPRSFAVFSVRTDLRGEAPNLAASELYTSGDFELSRGAGTLHLELDYRHGQWHEGARARYASSGLFIRKADTSVSGAAELEAKIVRGGKDAEVAFSAEVPHASIDFHGVPRAVERPTLSRIRATLGAKADLTQPHRWTSLSARARGALPALRWLNQPLEQPDLFLGGTAEAEARVAWSEGKRAAIDLELDTDRAAFMVLDQPVQLSGKLLGAASYDPDTERGQSTKLVLELPEVSLNADPLPGGMQIRSERLQWKGVPPETLDARFVMTSQTVETLVPLVIPSDVLRALAKALVNLGKTRAVVEVARTPAAWEWRLPEAKSGDVQVFGELRSEKHAEHPCGRWYVADGPLGIGLVQAGGETSVEPLVSAAWWRERPVAPRCAPTASRAPRRGSPRAK